MAFCGRCGSRLAAACPACGFDNPEDFAFCGKCGARLKREAPPPAFTSPRDYTPAHLVDRIITSKSALEGERKHVTVLFADLKGSLELLADRDPEDARKLLDPVLERMMEAVHRYEGTVNQVMGDGIMALFGAPVAHEDHAVRACYAAFDMQAALRRYADEVRRGHGVGLQIRVGLHSGEVVVRAVGSDLRMDYSAVGQTTHLAARMEQLAAPGATLLTATTLGLAEGYVAVRPLGPVPIKGLPEPVEVYEMTGTGPRRSRLHAATARGLTRFVGREIELEQLRQALARAASGRGQVVAVVGEPGVGKSRLVWELTHSHRTHGWLIVQTGAVSYGTSTPYRPVIDLLRGYFRIDDRDDRRAIREKVMGKLLALDRALEATVSALLALLDVPPEDSAWEALDPTQRRLRTLDAVRRLLLRESQVQPLLVVIEDLHWIDNETQALLDGLVESLPAARLFLFVNYRPEYRHGWGSKTYYTQIRLDSLPAESAGQLLQALLGVDPTVQPLNGLLIEQTEGNPFFLEETIQTLVETRALAGERGGYRLVAPLGALQVPATVQAVLAARIDRLSPDEKRLLQTAAVVGKNVPYPLLEVVAESSGAALLHGLARLQAAEFLYETSLGPDTEYTFKHALTHEVTYGSLLQDRRRSLHARILEAIERRDPERLDEQVERLAHHALRGEVWDKAVSYLRWAATKAHSRSAFREAVGHLREALGAVERLPETRETMEQAFDARMELRAALFQLGEAEQIRDCLSGAEPLAGALGDLGRIALVSGSVGNHCWWTGQPDRALVHAGQAYDTAVKLGDQYALGHGFGVGQAWHALGEYRRAIQYLAPVADSLSGDKLRWRPPGVGGFTSVFCRSWLSWSLSECGDIAAATDYSEEAVRIAELVENPSGLVQAYVEKGRLALFLGEVDRAILALERALEVNRQANVPIWRPWVTAVLGAAYAENGRTVEGVALLEEAIRDAEATRFMFGQSRRVAWLADAHRLAGRIDEAAALARRAIDLAVTHCERGHEAWAWHTLAQAGAAADHYRRAMALAEALEMRPLVAHCHLGLGRLQGAPEHLAAAAALFRESRMPHWLAQAEAPAG
jgi:class 3 adenylate cyclase/tetratricopeptide (TPR) repeat protein